MNKKSEVIPNIIQLHASKYLEHLEINTYKLLNQDIKSSDSYDTFYVNFKDDERNLSLDFRLVVYSDKSIIFISCSS